MINLMFLKYVLAYTLILSGAQLTAICWCISWIKKEGVPVLYFILGTAWLAIGLAWLTVL